MSIETSRPARQRRAFSFAWTATRRRC